MPRGRLGRYFPGKEYQTIVRIFSISSTIWVVSTIVGSLSAVYIGVSLNRINLIFVPSMSFGVVWRLVASLWIERVDKSSGDDWEGK
jgi:hypothetical protein